MAEVSPIIEMGSWLRSPAGQYLLTWEQSQLDRVVADIFGYHAVQIGWPVVQALRASRMGHRWMLTDGAAESESISPLDSASLIAAGVAASHSIPAGGGALPVSVLAEFDALPFPSNSLDLVVLPHTLEMTHDAHHTLREVERVLMPDGRVVIVGFNPASLWGVCRHLGGLNNRLALNSPMWSQGEHIGWRRLRDWMRLLGFEIESGRFGCYRPPYASQGWLERSVWWDHVGSHWWPVLGSVYIMVAVKRVPAIRIVGPEWKRRRRPRAAPAVVARSLPPGIPGSTQQTFENSHPK